MRDDIVEPLAAHIYVPSGRHYRSEMIVHVRTDPGREPAMLDTIRQAIHQVDARLPIVSLTTLMAIATAINDSVAVDRSRVRRAMIARTIAPTMIAMKYGSLSAGMHPST